MKLLLTSAGISNTSIRNALVDLLGKPISEASALFIPTAIYAIPAGADIARKVICGSLGFLSANRVGGLWECWSSPRCPASNRTFGFPCSRKLTPC